ncbi:hypothetical protein [Pseudotamlana carrageenivorans]|uniref:Carboxypeptidase-like regulatory domain-containing protein n=1 Tax=Pseudotamlana carrageenivorans TaxID=2069432 RepID=A0A2I7SKW9_9FLAO|nr:hypothetical protein [Tamlana carrageenivorans]AUS06520.1 hypothetical protein C1A40_14205 [Tamlana carrageenivorans]
MNIRKKISFLIFVLAFQLNNYAQSETFIKGQIVGEIENKENIYIYNKRSNNFTLSDTKGSFTSLVRLNDTLIFSGIQFGEKKIIIDKLKISSKKIIVELIEVIYELDEISLEKNMTGSLILDLKKVKDNSSKVNAVSLKLPYANTPKKTPFEFKIYTLSDNMGPINNFINKVSGRSKKNKKLQTIFKKDNQSKEVFSSYSKFIYTDVLNIPKDEIDTFIIYCEDDDEFWKVIKLNDKIKILNFIISKAKAYKKRIISK